MAALAGPLLQFAAGVVAAYGTWRCLRLQRIFPDRRLTVLALFFGLFAAAVALHAVWEVGVGQPGPGPGGWPRGPPSDGNFTGDLRWDANASAGPRALLPPFFRQEGPERVDVWLATSHVLMLASLAIAVWAFSRRHPQETPAVAAFVPFAFIGDLIPLLLGLQAGLTLYLAARSLINHVERRTPGAIQVMLGFLLFFLAHLSFYMQHSPGMGRSELGDVLNVVGIVLLVQALPGKR